ncbi:YihY/virulence factor BrkB family protein [Mycobacterium sp. IDR2000157661]|uniref:YihY/virulence factor BrkB family protein n=1 Tax=Mycobacterium sp. IDR2000157661 TaxID=2867005 RepID=UPI001EE9D184|nr:YihY/virulence factor BrkB family protein [Mycobacterium sp. IDR2000157661]ULE33509.1 YihY/virulence factor BrkB family protein [Mycobacterium sp. IDR2000157661]
MSSVPRVPETATMAGRELGGRTAWRVLGSGRRRLLIESFRRFRYGDGFSHSRALGFQLSLAMVPLMIAAVGLSNTYYSERSGTVLRLTLLQLTPGASDAVVGNALAHSWGDDSSVVALWLGVFVAVFAMTTGMGQVERGANRIYGIQRDRPALQKYTRAFGMAFLAGFPTLAGYILLVAATTFGEAVERVYGFDDDEITAAAMALGVALLLASVTAMLRFAPRRRQPAWSFLALGTGIVLMLWLVFTGIVVVYLAFSDNLGSVYGPLTAVVVLLLWGFLTSIALFFALAISAQVEATCAGEHEGAFEDTEIQPARVVPFTRGAAYCQRGGAQPSGTAEAVGS